MGGRKSPEQQKRVDKKEEREAFRSLKQQS